VVQYLNDLSEIGNEQYWEKGSILGFVVMNPKTIFVGHGNNFDIAWNNDSFSVFLMLQVDKSSKFFFFL
jgi:hypothetical protein